MSEVFKVAFRIELGFNLYENTFLLFDTVVVNYLNIWNDVALKFWS